VQCSSGRLPSNALREVRNSWRVRPSASILCKAKRVPPSNPTRPFYAKNLKPGVARKARRVCKKFHVRRKALLDACTLDVAVIGRAAAARGYVGPCAPVAVGIPKWRSPCRRCPIGTHWAYRGSRGLNGSTACVSSASERLTSCSSARRKTAEHAAVRSTLLLFGAVPRFESNGSENPRSASCPVVDPGLPVLRRERARLASGVLPQRASMPTPTSRARLRFVA
jgi:hypothetical protein